MRSLREERRGVKGRIEVWVGGAESGSICADDDRMGKLGAGERDGIAVLGRELRLERET